MGAGHLGRERAGSVAFRLFERSEDPNRDAFTVQPHRNSVGRIGAHLTRPESVVPVGPVPCGLEA